MTDSAPAAASDAADGLTIVLANFNQERVLAASVSKLRDVLSLLRTSLTFLLVDDGSTDGTWAESERLAASYGDIQLLRQPRNFGRGRAVADGVRAARTEFVATLDTDLEVAPHYLFPLLAAVKDGADLALARRNYPPPFAPSRVWELGRWIAHLGYRQLTRAALHTNLDMATGCKVLRRSAMLPVLDSVKDERWFWDTELAVRALRAGRRVVEVPVFCDGKPAGGSTVNAIPESFVYLYRVASLRHELARER